MAKKANSVTKSGGKKNKNKTKVDIIALSSISYFWILSTGAPTIFRESSGDAGSSLTIVVDKFPVDYRQKNYLRIICNRFLFDSLNYQRRSRSQKSSPSSQKKEKALRNKRKSAAVVVCSSISIHTMNIRDNRIKKTTDGGRTAISCWVTDNWRT